MRNINIHEKSSPFPVQKTRKMDILKFSLNILLFVLFFQNTLFILFFVSKIAFHKTKNTYVFKYILFLHLNIYIVFFMKRPFKTKRISLFFLYNFRFSLIPISSHHFCVSLLLFLRPQSVFLYSTRTLISYNFFSVLFSIYAVFVCYF